MEKTYEGWTNRATWNVALWIANDEPLYRAAVAFMAKAYKGKQPYKAFVRDMGMEQGQTPDRIKWMSAQLDYSELNDMMREFSPEGQRA